MFGKRHRDGDDSPNKQIKTEQNERQREFLDSVTVLKEKYSALIPRAFKEKVVIEYTLRLLQGLHNALNMPNEEECLAEIKTLLANNKQLIQGSMLCYSATPENEVTLLLCDIALWIEGITSESALSILLPGVVTESVSDYYLDLTELPLKDILKTHISSQCGNYLLPVKCMLDIELEKEVNETIFNPYYNYKKDTCAILSPSELERIYQHSATTHALRQTKLNYHQLIAQDLSLYSQLIKLTNALHLNSKDGLGSEENAASGAYPAIIDFHDYYQNLDGEQKNKIPGKLKKEIETLLSLSSDATVNANATVNFQTCLAKRRDALMAAMQSNSEQLMQIRLSGEGKQSLLEAQRKNFEQGRELLTKELNGGYCGTDKQPLTLAILSELGVELSVASIDELNDLMSLSAIELDLLPETKQSQLSEQIAQQFTCIGALVMFLIEKDCERLQVVLPKIKGALFEYTIRNAQDMAACLIALEGEKFKVVCQGLLGSDLPQFVRKGKHLRNVLQYLTPERCAEVCLAIKEHVLDMVKTPHNFTGLLRDLTSEQCAEICRAIKEKLPSIIKRAGGLRYILPEFAPKQCLEVFRVIKEQLPDIIKTAKDLRSLLFYLTPEQRAEVCTAFKEQWPGIIKTADDFNVLEKLAPEQFAEVIREIKARLPDIIKAAEDLLDVLRDLAPEQRAEVYQVVKEWLPDIIKAAKDLVNVLLYLAPEQRAEVYQAVKERLPDIIKTAEDLVDVLPYLAPEQRTEVYQAFKERLPDIIKTAWNLSNVLQRLAPEQRAEVYQAFKERLPDIIKTALDLSLLYRLTLEQRAEVVQAIKGRLPDIIKNAAEFYYVLPLLTPEQRHEFIGSIKGRLSSIIGSEAQIRILLAQYNIESPVLTPTNDDMEVDAPNALLFSDGSRRGNDNNQNLSRDHSQADAGAPSQSLNRPGG